MCLSKMGRSRNDENEKSGNLVRADGSDLCTRLLYLLHSCNPGLNNATHPSHSIVSCFYLKIAPL